MQVLELTAKRKKGEPLREDAPERTGVFTTGILSMTDDRPAQHCDFREHRWTITSQNRLALKMAIRHRKNSLYYKTQRGADVGDVYMILIHTCYFAGVDPLQYITELQTTALGPGRNRPPAP